MSTVHTIRQTPQHSYRRKKTAGNVRSPPMTNEDTAPQVQKVLRGETSHALLHGDTQLLLDTIPANSIECVITSPPYWQQREYEVGPEYSAALIGKEEDPEVYVERLKGVFSKVRRALKSDGSLWLNIGDKYRVKNLMGMPWRVALSLQRDGWILRNDVIWEKLKGTESVKDRLRHVYEHIFHFVKADDYYYDADAIRIAPRGKPTMLNGSMVSATGVSGRRYRQQIQNSEKLSEEEKRSAFDALDKTLSEMREGKIVDFRMTIRGQQRTLHSNSSSVSGRAKELEKRGYFILKSSSKGFVPSDIWRIVPEDEVRKDNNHYAVFPRELLRVPILATSRPGGVILDPFVGQGSTVIAALEHGRRAIGIDVSTDYLNIARAQLRSFPRPLEHYHLQPICTEIDTMLPIVASTSGLTVPSSLKCSRGNPPQ